MNNKKSIIQKENFEIELIKEQLQPSHSTNQLQNWCKLFECLSKHPKKAIKTTGIINKQASITSADSVGKKSLNTLREFRYRNKLRNNRADIYY